MFPSELSSQEPSLSPCPRSGRTRWPSIGAVGALALLALPGCFYPAERGRLLESKVDTLSAKNQALEAELAQAKKDLSSTLPRIDEKVREVTKALDSLDEASRRSDADASIQLQKTVEDVAQLRGQVETYLFKITELENQLKGLPAAQGAATPGDDGRGASDSKRKLEELERPRDKKAFLSLADEQRRAEDYSVARQLYMEWLKKWPRDSLAGEAHFGLGETYFREKKCREALFEYGKVIQEHARSKVAPTAYLRSAECFRQLKPPMEAEANLALEELVKNYPRSAEAKTAKQQLSGSKKKPSGRREQR